MVHRDIKPANLLIPRGALDESTAQFLAAGMAPPAPSWSRSSISASPACRRPRRPAPSFCSTKELYRHAGVCVAGQARNVHEVDIRSDLYSLGCSFYHALAGRPPFSAGRRAHPRAAHGTRAGRHRVASPEIPAALASIIRRLMAKKPEKRFQTPAELFNELGFFYSLDRSGFTHDAIRRLVGRGKPSDPAAPPRPAPMSSPLPYVPIPSPADSRLMAAESSEVQESQYTATRVHAWASRAWRNRERRRK